VSKTLRIIFEVISKLFAANYDFAAILFLKQHVPPPLQQAAFVPQQSFLFVVEASEV